MFVPQGFKKMVNVAGTQVTDARKYVFSMGRKTITTSSQAAPKTVINPKDNSSLMANTLLWANLIPPMPLIASTMYRYYAKGPPAKSWSLTTDITIAIIRDFLNRSSKITVEDIQKISTTKKLPVPSGMQRRKFTVPNEYRKRAGDILKKVFTKKDKDRISWDWEQDRSNLPPIKGEWMQAKGNPLDPCKESTILYLHGGAYYLGCYGVYRQFLGRLIRYSKGRTCSIDYRLAPQHPFPAAVEDSLATYLYLIDPPKDEESQPIDPKKIVIAGDSAGGGLTFALLMAIRDADLPVPAGAMTLSPWVDLTHSLPSILSNILTDYLPPTGFKHKPSVALDYAQLPAKKETEKVLAQAEAEAKDAHLSVPEEDDDAKRTSIGPFGECIPVPSINGEDVYRVHFYADNNELKIPMVSPIFDRKHLRGFPRLLVQCGTAERLRDESVYTALLASNSFPGADKDSEKLGKPAHVTLEMYTDQPHVFQLLFSTKQVSRAIKNLAAFVRDVTDSPANLEKKEPLSYLSDDLLTIRQVNPRGKMTDIKQEFVGDFTKEEWDEWKRRLARTSIRDRLEDVSHAYDNIYKEDHVSETH